MKIIIFILFMFLGGSFTNLSAVTIGLKCLYNPEKTKKIVIIYDKHEQCSELDSLHAHQIKTLIDSLSAYHQSVSFYIELDPLSQNSIKQSHCDTNSAGVTVIWIPFLLAVQHDFKKEQIIFKSFDERKAIDIFLGGIIANFEQVLKAAVAQQLPTAYFEITLAHYLQHLAARHNEMTVAIAGLPDEIGLPVKQKYDQIYTQLTDSIERCLQENAIVREIPLVTFLFTLANLDLYKTVSLQCLEEQNAFVDAALIHKVLHDYNILSVVHAGACHAYQLNKALCILGYHDAFPDRDLTNGFQAGSLFDLKLPTTILQDFISPINEFITVKNK